LQRNWQVLLEVAVVLLEVAVVLLLEVQVVEVVAAPEALVLWEAWQEELLEEVLPVSQDQSVQDPEQELWSDQEEGQVAFVAEEVVVVEVEVDSMALEKEVAVSV